MYVHVIFCVSEGGNLNRSFRLRGTRRGSVGRKCIMLQCVYYSSDSRKYVFEVAELHRPRSNPLSHRRVDEAIDRLTTEQQITAANPHANIPKRLLRSSPAELEIVARILSTAVFTRPQIGNIQTLGLTDPMPGS